VTGVVVLISTVNPDAHRVFSFVMTCPSILFYQ